MCYFWGRGSPGGGIPPTGLFVGGVTGRPQKSPFRTPVQKGSFAGASGTVERSKVLKIFWGVVRGSSLLVVLERGRGSFVSRFPLRLKLRNGKNPGVRGNRRFRLMRPCSRSAAAREGSARCMRINML